MRKVIKKCEIKRNKVWIGLIITDAFTVDDMKEVMNNKKIVYGEVKVE